MSDPEMLSGALRGEYDAAFLNIVVGDEDDGCPICVAVREGKSPAEVLALFGVDAPKGNVAVITVEVGRE